MLAGRPDAADGFGRYYADAENSRGVAGVVVFVVVDVVVGGVGIGIRELRCRPVDKG